MTEIEVRCGTRYPETFTIDLNKYDEARPTDADDATWYRALNLLISTMNDPTFADDGCRNNDAVNGCIALYVMGYDAETWFENFCAEQGVIERRWYQHDLDKFMEHVERVAPYLRSWGPRDHESEALQYII